VIFKKGVTDARELMGRVNRIASEIREDHYKALGQVAVGSGTD
jgi:hypothetical protein